MLVLTVGSGVHAFTLDRELGSFLLTSRDMKIPEDTKEFAINMSNQRHWYPPMQQYIDELLAGKPASRGKDFNMRWVARSEERRVGRVCVGTLLYRWSTFI